MNRPVIQFVPTIIELSSPLKRFGISYFSYAKIEGNLLAGYLNNLFLAESVLKMGAFKSNFLGENFSLAKGKKHIFLMEKAIAGTLIGNESIDLLHQSGVGNVLGIAERVDDIYHVFYFGSAPNNTHILEFYFNNLDILFNFIHFFMDAISHHKPLREGLNDRINFTGDLEDPHDIPDRHDFYQDLNLTKFYINSNDKSFLTKRELDCLALMRTGLRTKQISSRLNLSNRTIEEHILKIKQKLHCKNLIQIGERINDLNLKNILEDRLRDHKY
jgi:DNA-binding CsgD family transcriptional regulator